MIRQTHVYGFDGVPEHHGLEELYGVKRKYFPDSCEALMKLSEHFTLQLRDR